MTATLWEDLVFEVKPCCACVVVLNDRATDHFFFAESCIRVGDDREPARMDDLTDLTREVIEGQEPYIGHPRCDGCRAA